MQGTLPQNQSPPWAQESDYRCMPDASDRYLERPVQAGALFRKGLSCRQADGAFRCYFQGGGPGSTSQAGLYFQGRTGRRVRLRPSSISFFPAVPAAVFLRPFSFCFGYRFVSNFTPPAFPERQDQCGDSDGKPSPNEFVFRHTVIPPLRKNFMDSSCVEHDPSLMCVKQSRERSSACMVFRL